MYITHIIIQNNTGPAPVLPNWFGTKVRGVLHAPPRFLCTCLVLLWMCPTAKN